MSTVIEKKIKKNKEVYNLQSTIIWFSIPNLSNKLYLQLIVVLLVKVNSKIMSLKNVTRLPSNIFYPHQTFNFLLSKYYSLNNSHLLYQAFQKCLFFPISIKTPLFNFRVWLKPTWWKEQSNWNSKIQI